MSDLIDRQEVLDILKEKWNSFSCADDAMQESIDTIEDMPSVTPTQDCISRQAVLDLADKGILVGNHNYKSVCNAINDLPSATPTERTGHWYYDENRGATGIYAICSNCNESIYQTGDFRYCPNCGARMGSEDEG